MQQSVCKFIEIWVGNKQFYQFLFIYQFLFTTSCILVPELLFSYQQKLKEIRAKLYPMSQKLQLKSSFNMPKKNMIQKQQVNYRGILKNMKLEQDLRRIRHFKQMRKSMKKGKQQISEIEQELQKVEKQIHQKKQEIIRKQIQKNQEQKKQRSQFISQTNKVLKVVQQKNQEKKRNIDKFVNEISQKQVQKYQKTLDQRVNRYRNPINFGDLKEHENKYLNSKSSLEIQKNKFSQKIDKKQSVRVHSQIGSRYENEFENLSIDHKSILDQRVRDEFRQNKSKYKNARRQIVKLISKRNEYGNRVEKERKTERVKTEGNLQTKRQQQSRLFWDQIQQENLSIIQSRKPRLNTNLPKIDLKDCTKLFLRKINEDTKFSTFQKIEKLKTIQNSYLQKLKNNNPQAIDILSQLTLIKADLFLKA